MTKGVSISSLLKLVRQYHRTLESQALGGAGNDDSEGQANDDDDIERPLSEAELTSARWAWDWLRCRPQILINGNKRWNKLELDDVLALPEADDAGSAANAAGLKRPDAPQQASSGTAAKPKEGQKQKKTLTVRPRIHPSEDLVWQTLTRHGVDYKRVPALEWKCLLGIASVRAEGILQSDLRKLVDQDKRSLPKRTDSLAKKGYIAKRTIVVSKMKTSKLWLIDFAPPILEDRTGGLDLSPANLRTNDVSPVKWHNRWTGNNIDMEAFGRSLVGILKAWRVIKYSDLRSKMGVQGMHWQMKTLAKATQRMADMGVLKYTAATFDDHSRKVFKDCLKFIREPTAEEWAKFLATGKKTSQYSDATRHREPKPNALALYGGKNQDTEGNSQPKRQRIFPGWTPEKPLAQNVFEVIKSAGPEGASNPQISVATVGYAFRRYMSSHLNKVAETQQPPHLKHFQIISRLERVGKTTAYMFSVPQTTPAAEQAAAPQTNEAVSDLGNGVKQANNLSGTNPYGFGAVRAKAFPENHDMSLSELCGLARRSRPFARRRDRFLNRAEPTPAKINTPEAPLAPQEPERSQSQQVEQNTDENNEPEKVIQQGAVEETITVPEQTQGPGKGCPLAAAESHGSLVPETKRRGTKQQSILAMFQSQKAKTPKPIPQAEPVSEEQPQESELAGSLLDVTYGGTSGKLEVNRRERAVKFTTLGAEAGKQPFTFYVDDFLSDPVIRDAREGGGKNLVFATKNQNAKDASPAWSFVFTYDGSASNHQKALELQKTAIELRGDAAGENTIIAVPSTPQSTQEAPPPSPRASPTRGRGRGRGGATRGRGGRKAQALAAGGSKPFKCETCGGAWKNEGGLQYHQTKAQNPCNPNFDPATVLDRSRKRRRPSPDPPAASSVASGVEEEETQDRPAKRRKEPDTRKIGTRPGPKSKARAGIRPVHNPDIAFRGFALDEPQEPDEPLLPRAKRPRKPVASTPSLIDPSLVEGANDQTETAPAPLYPAEMDMGGNVTHHETGLREKNFSRREDVSAPGAVLVGDGMYKQQPETQLPSPKASTASPPGFPRFDHSPVAPKSVYPDIPEPGQRRAALSWHDSARTPAENDAEGLPAIVGVQYPELRETDNTRKEKPLTQKSRRDGRESVANGSATEAYPAHGLHDIARPFKPSINYYEMATEAKRKTAQALDIINYLLDNNCGVFPGDKALFFALTKVFLDKFEDQPPPTWKNFTNAIRALDHRKEAMVHTHMIRTERGKLIGVSLIVRPPGGGYVDPVVMDKKKQETKAKMMDRYPGLYIPSAFSPTPEVLAALEELIKKDTSSQANEKPNANGTKFRSRRKYDEVERFQAPYYKQIAARNAMESTDPLWIRESEQLPGYRDAEARKRGAVDDLNGGHRAKRQRSSLYDTEADPNSDRGPLSESRRGGRRGLTSPLRNKKRLQDDWYGRSYRYRDGEKPSVIEAIQTYGLLPAKGGRKVPRKPGPPPRPKIRNPGLDSLPLSFFGRGPNFSGFTPSIKFLAPRVSYEDILEDLKEGGEVDRNAAPSAPGEELSRDIAPEDLPSDADNSAEGGVKQPQELVFVPSSTLTEPSGGWKSEYEMRSFFEREDDTSFTIDAYFPGRKLILEQNLPANVGEMVKNKTNRFKPETWADPDWARFWCTIHQCMTWELSDHGSMLLSGGSVAPNYRFINVSPAVCKSNMKKPPNLRWPEYTQYTVENLPYRELLDDDGWVPQGRVKGRAQPNTATPGVRRGYGGRPTKFKLRAIKTEREHTAYPKSSDDFLRQPNDENEELDWNSENVRLTAFIVVTTLLGGVDRVVDWGLMMRLFPDLTLSQLRHFWGALKKDRQSTIISLTEKFRRAFLKAYAAGELPPIDFNDTLSYDWKALIKWTKGLEQAKQVRLPPSREDLEKQYHVSNLTSANREWRESYYHVQRSVFNRFQDATTEAISVPIDNNAKWEHSRDMVVSMAWTRSLSVTPVDLYTKEKMLKKRASLFPGRTKTELDRLLIEGTNQLQHDGVISQSTSKSSNGRLWRFSNRVTEMLEKMSQEDRVVQAIAFKKELDQAFREGKRKRVSYVTTDGMIMALLNMQAHGRVRIEPTGQPNVPMGHEPGNYETRKYPKKYIHFKVEVVPTERYVYNDDEGDEIAELRDRVKRAAPPNEGPGGATPAWCDVFGRVDGRRWIKYLSVVLVTLASRGSMPAEELCKTLKPVLMPFEAEMIFNWGERLGLLGRQIEGTALAVMEWWWIGLDVQREKVEQPRRALPSGRRNA